MPSFQILRVAAQLLFLLGITIPFASAQEVSRPPWEAAFQATGESPSFAEAALESFDTAKSLPQANELRQWFEVIVGQPQGIFETRTRIGQCAGIEGIARLKAPWSEETAFRFAMEDYNRLQIHFFHGTSGLTLAYHEDDLQKWTAYLTRREPRGVAPTQWTLVATDRHRNRRTNPKGHDQYELRWQSGEMLLTRGDVILLRSPFPDRPEEVFFQGKAAFHGLALVRTQAVPLPELAEPAGRSVLPSAVPWVQQLDEAARSEILPDGAMRLVSSDGAKKRSWIATPLPRDSLCEIVLEIANAKPGGGVYLGNGKDGPRYVLRYVTDRRSKQLCVMARPDDDLDEHEFRALHETSLPVVAPSHWLKLIFGAGQLRWQISPDGRHWAEPAEPVRNLPLDISHMGIHAAGRQRGTEITLNRFIVRALPGLEKLVPVGLTEKAPPRPAAPSLGAWLTEITELTPAHVETDSWRRACALETLARGTNRQLGTDLVLLLASDPFLRKLAAAERWEVLDALALLVDVWDDQNRLRSFLACYQQVGQDAWRERGELPFSSLRHALMTAPLTSRLPIEITSDDLIRAVIVDAVAAEDWPRLRALSRELRFFQLQTKVPLLDWADAWAMRKLPPGEVPTAAIARQKNEWRELLIEELSKEVYNALAQLRVELSDTGREDAARAIAALPRELTRGIAPHAADDRLLVSVPTAVRGVLRDDRGVGEVLAAKYSELARLRLLQAQERGDEAGIAMLRWQFAPTEAAREARVWMGDRALARGEFELAVSEYTAALAGTDNPAGTGTTATPEVVARQHLAATLAGRVPAAETSPAASPGTLRLAGSDLEKLIAELAARNKPENLAWTMDSGEPRPSTTVLAPSSLDVHRRSKLEGLLGNDPKKEFARDTARLQLDWVGRQLGITLAGNVMYVSNRFHVAAYDLKAQQRLWQSPAPTGQVQFAQESPFIPTRPLVRNRRLWVRLLYGAGSTLACLDQTNGQFVWTAVPSLQEDFVSDPFFLGGKLCCLAMGRTDQQQGVLKLLTLDDRTGFIWSSHDLLRLRDSWYRRRCCQVTSLADGLVVSLGGVVLRVDEAGDVSWVRKSLTLPPDEEPGWIRQWFQPPLVIGDQAVVMQPGVPHVECVHLETGDLVWSGLRFDVERLLAADHERCIVQLTGGLAALSMQDGKELWRTELEGLTAGTLASAAGILAVQNVPLESDRSKSRLRLVWVDTKTGGLQASTPLSALDDADVRIGPLVAAGDRLWTFGGKGQNDPQRDVIELAPAGSATLVALETANGHWTSLLNTTLSSSARRVFPRWELLHAEPGDRTGILADAVGEQEALGLRYKSTGAIAFGRRLQFAPQSRALLRLRFGNEPQQKWRIEVRFRGEEVWAREITAESHPQAWKDFEVDLSRLAGEDGWLTVRASLSQGGEAPSYWKKLEVVF